MHFIVNEIWFSFIASNDSWDILSSNLFTDSSAADTVGVEGVYRIWSVQSLCCSSTNNGKEKQNSKVDFTGGNPASAGEWAQCVLVCVWDSGLTKRWWKTENKSPPVTNYVHTSLLCAPEVHLHMLSYCSGNSFQDNCEKINDNTLYDPLYAESNIAISKKLALVRQLITHLGRVSYVRRL